MLGLPELRNIPQPEGNHIIPLELLDIFESSGPSLSREFICGRIGQILQKRIEIASRSDDQWSIHQRTEDQILLDNLKRYSSLDRNSVQYSTEQSALYQRLQDRSDRYKRVYQNIAAKAEDRYYKLHGEKERTDLGSEHYIGFEDRARMFGNFCNLNDPQTIRDLRDLAGLERTFSLSRRLLEEESAGRINEFGTSDEFQNEYFTFSGWLRLPQFD